MCLKVESNKTEQATRNETIASMASGERLKTEA